MCWLKPAAGFVAALHLGPAVLEPTSAGVLPALPAATSLALWVAAVGCGPVGGIDGASEVAVRGVFGWLWMLGSCAFASHALLLAGWLSPPFELGLVVVAVMLFVAMRRFWRNRSSLLWPAVVVVGIAALAFLWPDTASVPANVSAVVFGGLSALGLASFWNFRRLEKAA